MLSCTLLASVLLSVGLHFFLSANPVLDLVAKRSLALAANKHGGTRDAPLKGYVAVITGATSGIGLELAGQLSAMGANIVLVGRTQSKLERVAGHLRQLGICVYACHGISCIYIYVCICTYTCTYIWLCTYKYICLYVLICMHICIHTYICIHLHIYVSIYSSNYLSIYLHVMIYLSNYLSIYLPM